MKPEGKAAGGATAEAITPPQYLNGKATPADCPLCGGSGKIKDGHVTCPACHGSGNASDVSDEDKAKYAAQGKAVAGALAGDPAKAPVSGAGTWTGAASEYPDTAAYCAACIIDDNPAGQDKVQGLCHLPVQEPNGKLNPGAVTSAAGRLNQVDTSPASKKAAARKLVTLYGKIDADPPPALLEYAGEGKGVPFTAYGEVKSVDEVDTPKGHGLILKGYVNTWINDRDKEHFERQAFEKSLGTYMLNPVLIVGHDRLKPIGTLMERPVLDHIGVGTKYFVPEPPPGTEPWHVKAYHDLKNRVYRTFSVGGIFGRSKGPGIIDNMDWMETSIVSVPSNTLSVFEVAEQKGLTWAAEGKIAMLPAVLRHNHGPVSGRPGMATRRRTHDHPGAELPHLHGLHRHSGMSAKHQHGPAPLNHDHSGKGGFPVPAMKNKYTPIAPAGSMAGALPASLLPNTSVSGGAGSKASSDPPPSDAAGSAPPSGDGPDDADGFDTVSDLLQAVQKAVAELVQGSASDADKIATMQGILEDFAEEAKAIPLDATGDDSDEEGQRPSGKAAVNEAVGIMLANQRPDLAAQVKSVMAGWSTGTKEAKPKMKDENGNEIPEAGASSQAPPRETEGKGFGLDQAKQLEALLAEKRERDMATEAETKAAQRLEDEAKVAETKAAQDAADAVKLEAMVAAAVEAKRANLSTPRKFQHPTAGAKAGGARRISDWLKDMRDSRRGDFNAFGRLQEDQKAAQEAYGEGYGTKAVGESSTSSGGYLVPPEYYQQGLAELRIAAAKVRPLCTVIGGVNSNMVLVPRETGIAIVGWVAENAAKPSQDQTFSQISVPIYALAGISKVSNQLLEDSSPAVDQILRNDLGRTLGRAEDQAFLAGSGSGMPLGILATTGILTVTYATDSSGGSGIGDAISLAITAIQSAYFGDPNCVIVHPRVVGTLRQAKDSTGRYIFEAGYNQLMAPQLGGPATFMGGAAQTPVAVGSVWGLPVISDANIGTTYAAGTLTPTGGTDAPAIVANMDEAWIFERSGITVDVSNEAGTSFEANQTWYRGEERLGFTAARQPTAFAAILGLNSSITN
jgi:HK97 family phage major capsid protein